MDSGLRRNDTGIVRGKSFHKYEFDTHINLCFSPVIATAMIGPRGWTVIAAPR
jgi:hypothetical protein